MKTQCQSRRVREDAVQEAFTDMLYKLKAYRKEILGDLIGQLERVQSEQIQRQGIVCRIDTVVEPLVQKFEYNFDETPGFENVLVNGEEKRLNYGTLELFEDGTYEVGVVVNGKTYTFTVTVDATAPTIKLEGVEK